MGDVATLNVPADLYDEALAFVNERRKEQNLAPIDALPAGYSMKVESCPCAAECGADIRVGYWGYKWQSGGRPGGDFAPVEFIRYFDESSVRGVLTLPVRDVTLRASRRA